MSTPQTPTVEPPAQITRDLPPRAVVGRGLFLALAGVGVVVVGALLGLFVLADYRHDRDVIAAHQATHLEVVRQALMRDLERVVPDFRAFLEAPYAGRCAAAFDSVPCARLAREMRLFLEQRRLFQEVLLLDVAGRERVRVNHVDGRARRIPTQQLAAPAYRPYFMAALQLEPGRVHVSAVSYMGAAGAGGERRPRIRIATPVHGPDNRVQGVLVLDYVIGRLFEYLDRLLEGAAGTVFLLDGDGRWLHGGAAGGPDGGSAVAFHERFPAVWGRIQRDAAGEVLTAGGLFTYTTVHPIALLREHMSAPASGMYATAGADQWKLVSHVSNRAMFDGLRRELGGIGAAVGGAALLAVLLGAWWAAAAIGERRRLNQLLALHANVFEATTDGVLITDPRTRIVSVNEAFTRLTGYAREALLGRRPSMLSSGRHDAAFYSDMWAAINRDGHWQGEVWNRRADGKLFLERLRISAIRDDQDRVKAYVGVISDITAQRMNEEALRQRAHHDGLTGLPNRTLFEDRLNQAVARAQRAETHVALLYIDLDHFKPINDTHGHAVGDHVLQVLAGRMEATVRAMDTVARLGGDEFGVIMADVADQAQVDRLAERLLAALHEPVEHDGVALRVGASIGVALYPEDADDPQTLFSHADEAMYAVKHSGRGASRHFSPTG